MTRMSKIKYDLEKMEVGRCEREATSVSCLPSSDFLKFIFCCFFISLHLASYSQQSKIDSLITLIKNDRADTNKVNHLNILGRTLIFSKPDTVIILSKQAIAIAELLVNKKREGMQYNINRSISYAYNLLGTAYKVEGNYFNAIDYYSKALSIDEEIKDKIGESKRLGNIGTIYQEQANYPKAIDYYLRALKIGEELNNKDEIARHLSNIGGAFWYKGDTHKAMDYYLKALKINEEGEDKNTMANTLGNIGLIYQQQANYAMAFDYLFKALKISRETQDKTSVARQLNNIALTFNLQARTTSDSINKLELYNQALDGYFSTLKIYREIGFEEGIASCLQNIGEVYMSIGNQLEAEKNLIQALEIADSNGFLNVKLLSEETIYKLYHARGKYQLAYQHYKQYSQTKDSIFSIEKVKDITRKEMNYEFDKKEAATKAENEKQIALAEIAKKRKRIVIWAIIAGIILLSFIIVAVVRSLQITRKQKLVIEKQKTIVDEQRKLVEKQKHAIEEKQKEIMDSIHYAKHIQKAVMKGEKHIKTLLNSEHFIFFKPKDIVSGDFYWLSKREDKILIAVADCTGHGVSGGFMSMFGMLFLSEIVEKKGLLNPAEILTEMHKSVLASLNQTEADVQDGMEMVLCSIDIKNKTLEFSGAMSSLYLIQNHKLKEIEGDYFSIGGKSLFGGDNKAKFTNKTISLEKDTVLYLFTDGYMDQFGGERKEKFNLPRFEELLLSINKESMAFQQQKLNDTFENWIKPSAKQTRAYSQTDDVLVMGIKI